MILNDFEVNVSDTRFNVSSMREHLLQCVKSNTMSIFPKINKMPKMHRKETKNATIKLYCTSKLHDMISNMVKFSNKSCHKWYHESCIFNITDDWICPNC